MTQGGSNVGSIDYSKHITVDADKWSKRIVFTSMSLSAHNSLIFKITIIFNVLKFLKVLLCHKATKYIHNNHVVTKNERTVGISAAFPVP